MKKLLILALCLAMLGAVPSALAADAWDTSKVVYQEGDVAVTDAEKEAGNPIFVITLENGNEMRGELYPDLAPQSVGNFIALANSGYYDGLTFHRVIPGFVIQGGCPIGNGTGGPGWNIKGEFSENGVENPLAHTEGILSMARSRDMDSAGSQFFVMVGTATHLDGSYAAFGKVTEGVENAYDIVKVPTDASDMPTTPQVIKSIRVETFGVEYPFDKL